MPVEIERKFLVRDDGWRGLGPGQRYCQGYLAAGDVTVRVRRAGSRAYLTVKGAGDGLVRPEFEYEVPVQEAEDMFKLCRRPLIEKTRYEVLHDGVVWHVDEFAGRNAGLVIAEVELRHPHQRITLPAWVGPEVTADERFRNSRLVNDPLGDGEARSLAVEVEQARVRSRA